MPTFRSAGQLAKFQKAKAEAFRRSAGTVTAKEAERLRKRVETRALQLTSGTRTTRELAILGHPYKRSRRRYTQRQRAAREVLKAARLLPINRQTGRLQREMRVIALVQKIGNRYSVRLRLKNAAPYALAQLDPEGKGTPTMRSRGFWKALLKSYTLADLRQIRAARQREKRATERYLEGRYAR